MTEEEMKKYSYEELLNMYLQLKEEMERRGLYEKYLEEMARACLRAEKDPEFIAICEEHDRMMEEE